jgi:hypothetical protein
VPPPLIHVWISMPLVDDIWQNFSLTYVTVVLYQNQRAYSDGLKCEINAHYSSRGTAEHPQEMVGVQAEMAVLPCRISSFIHSFIHYIL